MKKLLSIRKESFFKILPSAFLSFFLVVIITYAASTISTNIVTEGTLGVTGASTLTGILYPNGGIDRSTAAALAIGATNANAVTITPDTTIAGTLGVTGASTLTGAVTTGAGLTVGGATTVTGLTTLGQASSTRFSVHDTAYFGGTATSTFNSAGNLSVAGTLGVTGVSTLTGNTILTTASSTGLVKVNSLRIAKTGTTNNTIEGLVFGYCTFASVNITASSTGMVSCTGATAVAASDRIFVMATSSLPNDFVIQAASSTESDVIQVDITNLGFTGAVATGINSLNFWAVR